MGIRSVGEVIEVNEAFFRESFNGNQEKSMTFTMPHRTHKRGVKGSFSSNTETRKRCISKEQVCVLCTDSHKSYIQLAQNLRIELQQIKRGKHKKVYIIYTY